jgi:hypothetical protein
MTKIILKSEAAPVFQFLRTPLAVLLHPTVLAYDESHSAIYIADPYVDVTVSRLTEAGMPIEVVKSRLDRVEKVIWREAEQFAGADWVAGMIGAITIAGLLWVAIALA